MKKILLGLACSLPLLLQANSTIEVGFGSATSEDSFSAAGNERITNHHTKENKQMPLPLVKFTYIQKNFIAKMGEDGLFFGYKDKKIEAGVFTGIDNHKPTTWENPYELNVDRIKTAVAKTGLATSYNIFQTKESGSKISYKLTKIDIEKDTVGTMDKELERDAINHRIKLDNRTHGNILYNVKYENNAASGKQSSYSTYGGGAGYIHKMENNLNLILMANYAITNYDEENSVLDEKIEVKTTDYEVILKWNNAFGIKDKHVNFIYTSANSDANHDFYDKKSQVVLVTTGFKF